MDTQTFLALLGRRGLMALAASLITWGWLQPNMSDAFVQIGLGITSGAGSLLLSWWNEKGHAQVLAELASLKARRLHESAGGTPLGLQAKGPTTAAAIRDAMNANKPKCPAPILRSDAPQE